MKMVSVHEAKTHLSKLLERARAGEEIVISKNGKPWARLCPLQQPEKRRPGLLSGSLDDGFFDELPEEELVAWKS